MKMDKADYQALKAVMAPYPVDPWRSVWHDFYDVPLAERAAWFDGRQIYRYLNDDHIATALKRIRQELTR